MADEASGRGGRCVHGADRRTGGWALTTRSSGRADERTGWKGRGRLGGRWRKGCGQWSGRADGRKRRGLGRWADRRTRADGHFGSPPVGQTGGQADERVGLGLKGHIPRGPLHPSAPSPLASSERERAGCLGVQWGPPRFHVKHLYLVP